MIGGGVIGRLNAYKNCCTVDGKAWCRRNGEDDEPSSPCDLALSDLILVENGSCESEGGCQTRLEIREDKHTSTKMSFAISGR